MFDVGPGRLPIAQSPVPRFTCHHPGPLHPRLSELFDNLDAERRALRETLDGVPEKERNARPSPDRWSVRDILEHLVIVERRIASSIATAIAQAKEAGLEAERDDSPVLSGAERATYLDRSRKLSAPPRIHPSGGDDVEALWASLEEARGSLKAAALTGDGLALGAVTQPHPFFGTLNVYQWLTFVAGHEARHAAQMREVVAQLRNGPLEARA